MSTPTEQPGPTQTYEQARDELADVVRRLEAGGLTLEESLALWERGEQLADVCQHWLTQARERLAAEQAGYPVVAPAGLPAGYRPTSARTDAVPDRTGQPVTLQIGYVTPSEEFAGFVVSDDLKADAVTSVLDGAAQRGTVDLGGTSWTRSTDARGETVLSRQDGDVVVLVSGSAKEQELETVARGVRPYPG